VERDLRIGRKSVQVISAGSRNLKSSTSKDLETEFGKITSGVLNRKQKKKKKKTVKEPDSKEHRDGRDGAGR